MNLDQDPKGGHLTMNAPPIVSPQEWEAARQLLLVKEKALTRARDALAAERRRMPWMAVEKQYEFQGHQAKASLLDLFAGRRQLIVYRAFFELYAMIVSSGGVRSLLRCPGSWAGGLFWMCGPAGCGAERGVA
jgi:predicted dithiol-disulfide oxidoreductase (DUF899 family)